MPSHCYTSCGIHLFAGLCSSLILVRKGFGQRESSAFCTHLQRFVVNTAILCSSVCMCPLMTRHPMNTSWRYSGDAATLFLQSLLTLSSHPPFSGKLNQSWHVPTSWLPHFSASILGAWRPSHHQVSVSKKKPTVPALVAPSSALFCCWGPGPLIPFQILPPVPLLSRNFSFFVLYEKSLLPQTLLPQCT